MPKPSGESGGHLRSLNGTVERAEYEIVRQTSERGEVIGYSAIVRCNIGENHDHALAPVPGSPERIWEVSGREAHVWPTYVEALRAKEQWERQQAGTAKEGR